jgi:general secretion pathway protein G
VRPCRSGHEGVTYIELVLVATMMGILATVALPVVNHAHRRSQEVQLRRSLMKIRAAIDEFHLDWEHGCIEPDDEKGWPKDLEELHAGLDWASTPECNPEQSSAAPPTGSGGLSMRDPHHSGVVRRDRDIEDKKTTKVYLRSIPEDPFNSRHDDADTDGWAARSYDDDADSTSWKGEGVYDVRSSSELHALDGTAYSSW